MGQKPKHRQIREILQKSILSGEYEPGRKLPSEAELVKRFGASRITVGRALRDLQQKGMVERRAGSGTYVKNRPSDGGLLLGLLIPDLGRTEIFEPICQGMSRLPDAERHALLWGNASSGAESDRGERALQLCMQYIDRRVAGVFFAPLELIPNQEAINLRILDLLKKARIPVVLLDRCAMPHPQRSPHDLVGIDNRRAGYRITEHLLELGRRRIAFVARPLSASTVDARIAGYREALLARGVALTEDLVTRLEPTNANAVRRAAEDLRPEAFVCANDRTAGELMHTLMSLGWRVPEDVGIGGIDDVEYARLLPVPLTTIRQPCLEIGEVAMAAMLERVARPELPARDILLDCRLVVRRSCGAPAGLTAPRAGGKV